MKHIKLYLNLALAIVFCASINTCTMEKEVSNTSGEWFEEWPTGTSNTSDESVVENEKMLREQVYNLTRIVDTINHTLKYDPHISPEESDKLQALIELGKKTFEQAIAMSEHLIPINIAFIEEKIRLIKKGQAEIINIKKQLLEAQINNLHSIINSIKKILRYDKNTPTEESDQLKALINHGQTTLTTAADMYLDRLAINTAYIDQKINGIIARLHEILSY